MPITHLSNTSDFNTDATQFRIMDAYQDTLFWVHHQRLLALDISTPDAPSEIGSVSLASDSGCALRVRSDGQYAFVGDGHSGIEGPDQKLRIFDVGDPTSMTEVATLDDADFERPHDVQLGPDEDYLYLCGYEANDGTGANSLAAVDVSDPQNPTKTSSVSIYQSHDVDVRSDGQYAFVSSHESGFYSVDISDPSNIQISDSIDYTNLWNGASMRLSDDENYAFMGAGDSPGYLKVIDVSDPTNVTEVASPEETRPYRMRVDGDNLYCAIPDSTSGSETFVSQWDISDPTNPSRVGQAGSLRYLDIELHPSENYLYGGDADANYLSAFEIDSTGVIVEVGNTLVVETDVTNTGSEAGDQDITLEQSDGVVVDTESNVQISSSATNSLVLKWQTQSGDEGDYTMTVASDNDSDSIDVSVQS